MRWLEGISDSMDMGVGELWELVTPSSYLILCLSFSSCPQSFPASGFSPVSWLFTPGGQSVGASVSISPSNKHSRLVSFRIDWLDRLAVQGTQESSPTPILWHSAFFMAQLSHLCMTSRKTIALTIWTFLGKVISLLFNMLSLS